MGVAEEADVSIVLTAITIHDTGFLYGADGRSHGAIGADKVTEYLWGSQITYLEGIINKMADCIRIHKVSMHN